MPEIKIMYSWNSMGQGGIDQYIASVVPEGELRKIDAEQIKEIITTRNQERRWVHNENEKLFDVDLIEENKNYLIYYNYHSNSGYKTTIDIDQERNIKIKIDNPKGIVLHAFWSEVIIFEIVE